MAARRVAITGIGVVSPFGVGREVFWDHVSRGVSGTRAVDGFDTSQLSSRVAAWVPDADLRTGSRRRSSGRRRRSTATATATATAAPIRGGTRRSHALRCSRRARR